ncbi:PP2C family serine/threonine-protein phosphatase [Endozoicomonas elysicola]|uniref:PPM-type phosphatase domain-containing protein n=1 Tax=Endozoicomonas elysicola TaxID=305900 RepID=A0A081K830_9GAMM|nr:PP2C family protein-serine/threonine phosphatase [Endozoicomonas elysicola]KEI70306.1 hypothetical protein GV64_05750 [Endozoicomonas elysicola]
MLNLDISNAVLNQSSWKSESVAKKHRGSDENTPPPDLFREASPFNTETQYDLGYEVNHNTLKDGFRLIDSHPRVLENPENKISNIEQDELRKFEEGKAEFFIKRAGSTDQQRMERWVESVLAENLEYARDQKDNPIRRPDSQRQTNPVLEAGPHFLSDRAVSFGWQYKSKKGEDFCIAGRFEILVSGERAPFFFSCVCDGHGGQEVARLVQAEIPAVLSKAMTLSCKNGIDPASVYYALNLTFEHLQNQVDEHIKSMPLAVVKKGKGTTVNLMVQEGKHTWFANAGDSRGCVLKRDFSGIIQATEDATCSKPRFVEKVTNMGGFIAPNKKVNEAVATPCAIGTYYIRKSEYTQERGFIKVIDHEPAITRVVTGKYPWVVQASDGLWNVVSTEDTQKLILKHQLNKPDYIAQMLLKEAHSRWDRDLKRVPEYKRRPIDDITVQVTIFSTPKVLGLSQEVSTDN